MADRADLLEIAIRQDRLADFQPLGMRHAGVVEEIRPRTDERDKAHHQFLADRVDRRVGDLGEVLLEIGVKQLRLVGHRRDRRVGAHRTDRFLTGRRHRRHQQLGVFLAVAKGLLAVDQRHVAAQRAGLDRLQVFEDQLGVVEPPAVGMLAGKRRLHLLVGDDAALFHVDQQHLARLQAPLLDDLVLIDRQHAGFRRHDDAVVVGDDVAGRTQAVAVERGADLATVGEGDRRRSVPRLHERRVIFVECLALRRHQLVAGPGFRDQHHHRMRQRIAALDEELERVVETRRVRLALVGNRPELRDVVAEQRRGNRRLPRRHPVDVAAQRVDFAVMRHHAVGMRQLPGREGVRREALVNQRHRRLEALVGEVLVIGTDLVGEEHTLVDDGRGRQRHDIEAEVAAIRFRIDAVGDHLAQREQPPLEFGIGGGVAASTDEDLHMVRLGGGDVGRLGERRIVDRHVAEAEQVLPFLGHDLADHLLEMGDQLLVARHEEVADGIFAGLRQGDSLARHLLTEEAIGNLHENARAVTHQRVGADGAAMRQVFEHEQAVAHDLVRLLALHMSDEADAAGIVFVARIIEALFSRQTGGECGRFHSRRDTVREVGPNLL
ncbi:hypothetical protein ABIE77_005780 [Sinorhizobium fredii]